MSSIKNNDVIKIMRLKTRLIAMICPGKVFISSRRFAPKYWDIIAEIADLVWAKTQNIADKKEPAMPTAANDSIGFVVTLPTMAVSVIESKGSAIPAIIAGIANLLIFLNVILDFN